VRGERKATSHVSPAATSLTRSVPHSSPQFPHEFSRPRRTPPPPLTGDENSWPTWLPPHWPPPGYTLCRTATENLPFPRAPTSAATPVLCRHVQWPLQLAPCHLSTYLPTTHANSLPLFEPCQGVSIKESTLHDLSFRFRVAERPWQT
jgi:hypothetical protein